MVECQDDTQKQTDITELQQALDSLPDQVKDNLNRVEEDDIRAESLTDLYLLGKNIIGLNNIRDSAQSTPPEDPEDEDVYLDDGTNTKTDTMGWRSWNKEKDKWVDIGGALGFWDGENPPNVRSINIANNFPMIEYSDTGQPYVKVKVSWPSVNVLDLKGYTLQITSKEGTWEGGGHYFDEINLGRNANEYTFEPLEQGTEYYIRIRAEDIEGLSSERWADVKSPAVSTSAPTAPTNISVASVPQGVEATWDNSTNRGFREVYVLIKEGAPPTKESYDDDNREVRGDFDYLANGNINSYTLNTTDKETTFYFGFFTVDLTGKDSNLVTDLSYSASPSVDRGVDIPSGDYIDQILTGDRVIGIIFDHGAWIGFDRYKLSYQYDDGSGWNGSWIELLEDRSVAYKHSNLYSGYLYKYKLEVIDTNDDIQDTTIDDNGGVGYKPDETDNQNLINNTVLANLIVAEEEVRAPNLYVTDLADIENLLTVSDQVKIGKDVLGSGQSGIQVTDGSGNPRVNIGELSGSYGLEVMDSNGDLIFNSSTAPASEGLISGTYLKEINAGDITAGSVTVPSAPSVSISPSEAGLYLGSNRMGYHDGASWQAYIASDGAGELAQGNISWDDSGNAVFDGTVYINGTATGNLATKDEVDDALVVDGGLTAAAINVDDLFAQNITLTGYIRSDNYDQGNSGWEIEGNGNAEFNDVTVRGEIDGSEYSTTIEVRSSDPSSPQDGRIWVVQ